MKYIKATGAVLAIVLSLAMSTTSMAQPTDPPAPTPPAAPEEPDGGSVNPKLQNGSHDALHAQ
jgi:hypothetical protein